MQLVLDPLILSGQQYYLAIVLGQEYAKCAFFLLENTDSD